MQGDIKRDPKVKASPRCPTCNLSLSNEIGSLVNRSNSHWAALSESRHRSTNRLNAITVNRRYASEIMYNQPNSRYCPHMLSLCRGCCECNIDRLLPDKPICTRPTNFPLLRSHALIPHPNGVHITSLIVTTATVSSRHLDVNITKHDQRAGSPSGKQEQYIQNMFAHILELCRRCSGRNIGNFLPDKPIRTELTDRPFLRGRTLTPHPDGVHTDLLACSHFIFFCWYSMAVARVEKQLCII